MSSSNQNSSTRNGTGRRKVDMVKIENNNNRQVTYSKRQLGLFKKASELSILSGAEVAIVSFSPGNKVYSFGYPDVDVIVHRFLSKNNSPESDADKLLQAYRNANISQQTLQLNQVESHLELEKMRAKELDGQLKKISQSQSPCLPINELNYQQLHEFKEALLNFSHSFETKAYNATSFKTPKVPGTNPHLETKEISQWPISRGASFDVQFNSNMQMPSFDNNGSRRTMFDGNVPLVHFGSYAPVSFDIGGASNCNTLIHTNPRADNRTSSNYVIAYDSTNGRSNLTSPHGSTSNSSNIISPNMIPHDIDRKN